MPWATGLAPKCCSGSASWKRSHNYNQCLLGAQGVRSPLSHQLLLGLCGVGRFTLVCITMSALSQEAKDCVVRGGAASQWLFLCQGPPEDASCYCSRLPELFLLATQVSKTAVWDFCWGALSQGGLRDRQCVQWPVLWILGFSLLHVNLGNVGGCGGPGEVM